MNHKPLLEGVERAGSICFVGPMLRFRVSDQTMLIPANMLSFRLERAVNAQLERIPWTRLAGYLMSPCELRALMMGIDRRYVNQVSKALEMHPNHAVALL